VYWGIHQDRWAGTGRNWPIFFWPLTISITIGRSSPTTAGFWQNEADWICQAHRTPQDRRTRQLHLTRRHYDLFVERFAMMAIVLTDENSSAQLSHLSTFVILHGAFAIDTG
jgi:hypothetical protein